MHRAALCHRLRALLQKVMEHSAEAEAADVEAALASATRASLAPVEVVRYFIRWLICSDSSIRLSLEELEENVIQTAHRMLAQYSSGNLSPLSRKHAAGLSLELGKWNLFHHRFSEAGVLFRQALSMIDDESGPSSKH